jgi:hypothetical protein
MDNRGLPKFLMNKNKSEQKFEAKELDNQEYYSTNVIKQDISPIHLKNNFYDDELEDDYFSNNFKQNSKGN